MLLVLSMSFFAQAQLDSLHNIWKDTKQPDSLRIRAYHKYIWHGYMFSKPDSAIIFSEKLIDFAEDKKFQWAIADALHLKGHANYIQGDFETALETYFQSLELRDTIREKRSMAASLGNMANIYKDQADYHSALRFENESLRLSRDINNKSFIAVSLNNLGVIYNLQGLYAKSLDYYTRGLKIRQEIGDIQRIATSYNNIATIYSNMGNHRKALQYLYDAMIIRKNGNNKFMLAGNYTNIAVEYNSLKEFDSALIYNQRALDIAKEIGDKNGTAWVLHNQGHVYKSIYDYDKAINYFEQSLQIMRTIGSQEEPVFIRSLIAIGEIAYEEKDYGKAISNCFSARSKAEDVGIITEQKSACKCLYDSYKAIGNSRKALDYHEKMLILTDSLHKEETTKKLQLMEFEKQVLSDSLQEVEKDLKVEFAHQTEIQKKNKNKNIALAGGIFFLLLSGGFYSRWNYVKKSKAIVEKEKDRSDNLLLNILPSEIAEELKAKGSAEARDFDLVSMLFTDFKGFTEASEKLTAKELIGEINTCFKAFDYICEAHGIEKIKTIGDAFMAAGGLPVPSDDSVKNTVLSALEMQKFISDRLAEKELNNEIAFKMRVGIHTGPVVAGIVGVKKFQYDIWGDTVNTASRMESSGEVGRVNISEATFNLLKNDTDFTFESRGKIKAKGKGEIEMYFVAKS